MIACSNDPSRIPFTLSVFAIVLSYTLLMLSVVTLFTCL
jgi:hypothetical protein